MSKTDSDHDDGDEKVHDDPPTIVEWVTRLAAAVLVIGLFGYLLWHATDLNKPAAFDFTVEGDKAERMGTVWRTPVTVTNTGDEGVKELKISADVPGVKQTYTLLVSQIGPGERYDFTLFLQDDPRELPPVFRVESHQ
ncbi:hypothetical protein [Oricola cellulosilytica]|uniref:TIGR02588 family protein n=1 Tax=Oricola cellulosilytica TaxID=1429082 RepID=A0A4V2MNP3_9HYPH|nr:hypothetical protein [Oricola cellulosilytica]TCD13836.1 hypothetical protein E0D97_12115 [Oricola cellulosilytica]